MTDLRTRIAIAIKEDCKPTDGTLAVAGAALGAIERAGYAIVPVCKHFSKDPILHEVNVYFENTQEMDAFFEAMKPSVKGTPKP
jgi:hypothetical protein